LARQNIESCILPKLQYISLFRNIYRATPAMARNRVDRPWPNMPTGWDYQTGKKNRFNCGHSVHRRGGFSAAARRHHPFNEPADGSQPASGDSGQPRKTDAHAAGGRLCLGAVALNGWGAWQDHLKNEWRRAAAENPPRRTSDNVEPV
jgi:hypothetical protein